MTHQYPIAGTNRKQIIIPDPATPVVPSKAVNSINHMYNKFVLKACKNPHPSTKNRSKKIGLEVLWNTIVTSFLLTFLLA